MDYIDALRRRARGGFMPVIADLKRLSPKEGELMRGRDPIELAKALVSAGAPALSVVTEQEHFGGSLDMLSRIAGACGVPVLRKDFIRTKAEIRESARAGASAVLLIAAMLDKNLLFELYGEALEYGLVALAETHSIAEMEMVNALHAGLVGINNRDIIALEKDDGTVDTTVKLIGAAEGNPLIVSESSIATAADIMRARDAGANAVLVGTALLRADNIAEKYRELSVPLAGRMQ